MGRLGGALLKGVGVLVLAAIALSAIATIVGIVFGLIVTIVELVVTAAMIALVALAVVGLYSLLSGSGSDDATRHEQPGDAWRTAGTQDSLRRAEDESGGWTERIPGMGDGSEAGDDARGRERDPRDRLRQQYVDGEIGEAEFERKMDQLMETERLERQVERDGVDDPTERDRLRER